ncbi:MAG TPA: alpha/beta hydrolase, partial [Thermoanaerobaculia bacterium]|nr:alpha/beta hydrolase [Thermoanaerobaculia bacterium]
MPSALTEMTVAGTRLEVQHYVPHGHAVASPHPPTLVFLHEGLGSVGLWRDFPQALADLTGCPALAYSRQGYGRSAPIALPRPLSFMHDEART